MLPRSICLFALVAAQAPAQGERFDATADTSIVLHPDELHDCHGRRSRIRIKGNQHLVALGFDASELAGRAVRRATLVCQRAGEEIEHVTVSTIQCPWDEHRANALRSGFDEDGWGATSVRFPAVTGGNSNSLVCQSSGRSAHGAYRWEIDPDLVHAIACGVAFGLTVHEADADYSRNPTIFARESRDRVPYLLLEFGGEVPAPGAVSELRAVERDGDAFLVMRAPSDGFAYRITIDGRQLPRWNIPFVDPGVEQFVALRDIAIGESFDVEVTTINRVGAKSRPVRARLAQPVRANTWHAPEIERPPARKPSHEGMWALPIIDRYTDAGRAVGDLPAGYRTDNPVFDGATIRLRAARGEVTGFQLIARGRGQAVVSCRLDGLRSDIWHARPVDGLPDPLWARRTAPLNPERDTVFVVDVFVPFDAPAGEVEGEVDLGDGRSLPISLVVRDLTLPRRAHFACEMNAYGLPDTMARFYEIQERAYDHRVHVNFVPYGHTSTAPDVRPANMDCVMRDGRRMDEGRYNSIEPGARHGFWDDFVTAFGPYLSGSHFANAHRGAVPAPGFYLTFHESWPLKVRDWFNGDPDAFRAFDDPEYARTFTAVLTDFANTARREGWEDAGFQVYFNNKGRLDDPRRAPWVLDEPASYWDYRALRFYGELIEASGAATGTRIDLRVDISRPQFDRGQLRNVAQLWVVNMGAFRSYRRLLRDRSRASGERIWVYATANHPRVSNRTMQAWVLEALRGGASGVVPWQTLDRSGQGLTEPNPLGLFVVDPTDGTVRHSMRLAAFRRAQQDAEYLLMLRRERDWSTRELARFIDAHVDVDGSIVQAGADDAGRLSYQDLDPWKFWRLREAAAALLSR